MFNYYVTCLKKYADFSGRSSRPEYWYFILVNFLICLVLGFLGIEILSSVYGLFVFIPGLSAFCRRMHDSGRSGWNWLWALIPVIGAIIVIVLACMPTKSGANKYAK